MKTTTATEESDSSKSLKNDTNSNEKKPEIEEMKPSTSSDLPVSEEQQDSTDKLFEPTVDMIVNDFDDEQTLEEEEKLAEKEHLDPADELNDLEREGEMPIEELLKLYGCAPPSCSGATNAGTSSTSSRKRRRRNEKVSPNNKIPTVKNPSLDVDCGEQPPTVQSAKEESPLPDDDTNTTTTTINNLENQSMDETNYEEEEPSALNKLYPDMFGKDGNDGILKLDVSDEEDFDYSPDEDDGKKTIMVGSDYQALIPEELCKYDDALPYENEDKLLWDPSKLNDAEIEDYLQKFNSIQKFSALASSQNQTSTISTVNGKHLRDDEQALFLLVQCGGNYEEALRRRRLLGAVQPSTTQSMSIWSEDECKNFECGLRTYGKRFNEIQHSKVNTRSVGEIVQFYYLWKKTERHDAFANKQRLEKKKYSLNPCATDLMERFLDEIDNGGSNRDRSVSPNSSLLMGDHKRMMTHIVAHIEKPTVELSDSKVVE